MNNINQTKNKVERFLLQVLICCTSCIYENVTFLCYLYLPKYLITIIFEHTFLSSRRTKIAP